MYLNYRIYSYLQCNIYSNICTELTELMFLKNSISCTLILNNNNKYKFLNFYFMVGKAYIRLTVPQLTNQKPLFQRTVQYYWVKRNKWQLVTTVFGVPYETFQCVCLSAAVTIGLWSRRGPISVWNTSGKWLSALAACLEEAHEIPFFVGCMVGGGEATFMAKP